MKGIKVCSNEDPFNSQKVDNGFFPSINQRYDIFICVYWFELFSNVSHLSHGPLVPIISMKEFVLKISLCILILKLQLPNIPSNVIVSATGHGIGHIQVSKLSTIHVPKNNIFI